MIWCVTHYDVSRSLIFRKKHMQKENATPQPIPSILHTDYVTISFIVCIAHTTSDESTHVETE